MGLPLVDYTSVVRCGASPGGLALELQTVWEQDPGADQFIGGVTSQRTFGTAGGTVSEAEACVSVVPAAMPGEPPARGRVSAGPGGPSCKA